MTGRQQELKLGRRGKAAQGHLLRGKSLAARRNRCGLMNKEAGEGGYDADGAYENASVPEEFLIG